MTIATSTLDGGILNVTMDGRLDLQGVDAADRGLAVALAGAQRVVIDLALVPFIASLGVRTLLTNARAVQGRGGLVALYNVTTDIERVLRVSGIDTVIPVVADRAAAVAAVSA